MLASTTCAGATRFYAMVARPGCQTKILKSYTEVPLKVSTPFVDITVQGCEKGPYGTILLTFVLLILSENYDLNICIFIMAFLLI